MVAKLISCFTAGLLTAASINYATAMEKDEPKKNIQIPAAIMGKVVGQVTLK